MRYDDLTEKLLTKIDDALLGTTNVYENPGKSELKAIFKQIVKFWKERGIDTPEDDENEMRARAFLLLDENKLIAWPGTSLIHFDMAKHLGMDFNKSSKNILSLMLTLTDIEFAQSSGFWTNAVENMGGVEVVSDIVRKHPLIKRIYGETTGEVKFSEKG